jgi:hypothetical protein
MNSKISKSLTDSIIKQSKLINSQINSQIKRGKASIILLDKVFEKFMKERKEKLKILKKKKYLAICYLQDSDFIVVEKAKEILGI